MKPQDGGFCFKCRLSKGVKYFYWFLCKGQQIVDLSRPTETNQQGQLANWLCVGVADDEMSGEYEECKQEQQIGQTEDFLFPNEAQVLS